MANEQVKELAEFEQKLARILWNFKQSAKSSDSAQKWIDKIKDVYEAAGYRKPAPSEKLVDEIKKILEQSEMGTCEHSWTSVCSDCVARSLSSLLPEMKLIGDEEMAEYCATHADVGYRCGIMDGKACQRCNRKAQLAADRR